MRPPFYMKFVWFNWPLLLVAIACVLGGAACIYSATLYADQESLRNNHIKHLVFAGIGIAVCFIVACIDYRFWLRLRWFIFAAGIAALLVVFIPGLGVEKNNALSWIEIGGTSVQPAELAKLSFILFLAAYLAARGENVRSLLTFCVCCLVMCLYVGIILKQPDLGSAMVFIPVCFAMMFVAGVAKRWLFLGLCAGVWGSVGAFLYVLKPYQKARLWTVIKPDFDPQGAGWHLIQSRLAIGSGGLYGKGFKEGTQNMLGYLPKDVSFSDFIFPVVAEEFGFIGSAVLIAALSLIMLLGLIIAARARDLAGCLIAVGVVALLFIHIFENVGMTIGVMPITGIPLPFISYGGTFLLACFIAIGLLQSVHIHRRFPVPNPNTSD